MKKEIEYKDKFTEEVIKTVNYINKNSPISLNNHRKFVVGEVIQDMGNNERITKRKAEQLKNSILFSIKDKANTNPKNSPYYISPQKAKKLKQEMTRKLDY